MNFEWSQEEKAAYEDFGKFCAEVIAPGGEKLAAGGSPATELLRSRQRELGGVGYLGLCRSSSWGGRDATVQVQMAYTEILARTCRTTCLSAYTSGVHAGALIEGFGSEEQKRDVLERLLSGEEVASLARSEAGGGVDLGSMKTRVQEVGEGFLLEGEKSFCVNGPMADHFLVFAGAAEEGGEPFCLLVPAGLEGVEVGDPFPLMGYEGLPLAPVRFHGVRLGPEALLGREDVLEESAQWDAMGIAASSVGILEACLEIAFPYSMERAAFGKPIGRYQEVSFKLAEIRAMLDTARLLSQKGAWAKETGDREAGELISCAKLFGAESAVTATRYALQILGAAGMRRGSAAERLYRDAKMNEIGGGTSEIHRLRIARAVLDAV